MVCWTSAGGAAFPNSGTGGEAVSELFYFSMTEKVLKNASHLCQSAKKARHDPEALPQLSRSNFERALYLSYAV